MSTHANARCENCPLLKSRTCPPKLKGGCDLMIIGEGPGKEEILQQTPFVGPSGRLLQTALKQAGVLDSTRISVSNATLCKPPINHKVDDDQVRCCQRRLHAEIRAEQPKVILALGNHAAHAITNDFSTKISQIHGSVIEVDHGWNGAIKVIPCIHPAAVLRKGSDYSKMQKAIDYAVALTSGRTTPKDPGETKFSVVTAETVESICTKLKAKGIVEKFVVGADIETTGFNPRSDELVALGIAWDVNKVLIFPGALVRNHPAVHRMLESPHITFVWHNGKFDVKFLRHLDIQARVDEDCMLAHYAMNEVKGTHDLEQLSGEYLGAPDYKGEVSRYVKKGWKGCPPTVLARYLARDCDFTLQLWQHLRREISSVDGLEDLYRRVLLRASELLLDVEGNGFWANPNELASLRSHLEPTLEGAHAKIQQTVIEMWPRTKAFKETGAYAPEINPNSPKQLCELLYTHMRLKPPKGFDANTREETLKVLGTHPVVEALLDHRKAAKTLSTYVTGVEERIDAQTGRIHATYLIHGTVTGRLSSRNPNLQNIPRDPRIRGVFQAPPGRLLLETDLDQAELRVLANLSKDPELVAIYNSGRKLHHEVATEMYGEGFTADQYIRAKAINFGIMYGRGAASLVQEFGGPNIQKEARLTLPEAERLIKAWFGRFPVAYEFVQSCRRAPQAGAALRSPTGRRRRFGLVTERNLYELQNEASNFPIQSTASDITLMSAWHMRDLAASLDALMVNLVHDSIIYEIPDSQDVAREISVQTATHFQRVGEELMGDAVPMLAEFKIGTRWGSLQKVKF